MDQLTWRPTLVIFWSTKAQNNASQYNFTTVIKFYETLLSQLDPPKIKNKGQYLQLFAWKLLNRVETTEADMSLRPISVDIKTDK